MIGIVLSGHGSFPNGLLESVQLIAGKVECIRAVSFTNDTAMLERELAEAIEAVDTGAGVVCLTDLAGGTPFNTCARIAAEKTNIRVAGGVNAPMLLSGLFQREQDLDSFMHKTLHDGKENIKVFQLKSRQPTSNPDGI